MTIYTDNFNRANGAINVGNSDWVAWGSKAMPAITASTVVGLNAVVGAYYNQTFSGDQSCALLLNGLNQNFATRNAYMFVRGNGSDLACYMLNVVSTDNGETGYDLFASVNILNAAGGVAAVIGSYNEPDAGGNGAFTLAATGSTINAYRGGVLIISGNDSSIAGGKPGFYAVAGGAGPAADQFSAEDFGGGGGGGAAVFNVIVNTLPATAPGRLIFSYG